MKQSGIDLFLCVSTDPHMSEYLCDHFKVTEYFSGCTSDNVVLAVDAADADKTLAALEAAGEKAYRIGRIEAGQKGVELC